MKFFSTIFILAGLACLIYAGYYLWLRYDPNRLSFTNYRPGTYISVNTKHFPTKITIPALHINLPIIPAKIINNKWQTTDNGASYLLSSPLPGTKGNSIIYAHDFASLFGPLVNAKPGEKVIISYSDGSQQTFIISGTQIVTSDNASILAPSQDSRVTLYTCTGWFDAQRFVVVAVLANNMHK